MKKIWHCISLRALPFPGSIPKSPGISPHNLAIQTLNRLPLARRGPATLPWTHTASVYTDVYILFFYKCLCVLSLDLST